MWIYRDLLIDSICNLRECHLIITMFNKLECESSLCVDFQQQMSCRTKTIGNFLLQIMATSVDQNVEFAQVLHRIVEQIEAIVEELFRHMLIAFDPNSRPHSDVEARQLAVTIDEFQNLHKVTMFQITCVRVELELLQTRNGNVAQA